MELEALKRGSDGGASVADGGQAADLAAALKEQTEALKEALSARTGSNSITTVKTDLVWPTLTDDKSDTKDVVLFYEEFEDVCALVNNCRGMSAREKLLALRARCKGSRAKTYTNAYRAAWKTGEVVDDPEAVYLRIKNKHLMFGESRDKREVRIDGEHQALVKGRLSGHQFEPLFEASVAGRPRKDVSRALLELPSQDAPALAEGDPPGQADLAGRRQGSGSPVPCHVGRVPQGGSRVRAARGGAPSGGPLDVLDDGRGVFGPFCSPCQGAEGDPRAQGGCQGGRGQAFWRGGQGQHLGGRSWRQGWRKGSSEVCFHFRDHGNCPKGDSCPFSHDKELRKQALAAKRGESTLAAKGGKGGQKGGAKGAAKAKPKAKPKAAAKSTAKPPGTICPFFQKTGSCRKGANCDMVHQLAGRARSSLAGQLGPFSWERP